MASMLHLWDAEARKLVKKRRMQDKGRCVDISADGRRIAVGFRTGAFRVYSSGGDMREVVYKKHCREDITDIKFSPDMKMLAVGSRDNYIDVYSTAHDRYKHISRCKGHASYITHLDWSADSQVLQSNCGAYEILYWDARSGKNIVSVRDNVESDTIWPSYTCVLGFPVMGIWLDGSDGTDVNALHLSDDGRLVVTADDFGNVRVFNAPCVVEDAPSHLLHGHSSHVTGIRFLAGNKSVVSIGGHDECVFLWKTVGIDKRPGFDPLNQSKAWKPIGVFYP